MRLRTFTARTMPEAMAQVRQALGPDAVILSTGGERGMIAVTAALDLQDAPGAPAAPALPPVDIEEVVGEALAAHGTPARLADRLVAAAIELASEDPVLALAGALDAVYGFAPLSDRRPARPLMLVGPPGAGKTVSIAKLATRLVMTGQRLRVVSSDTVRAGGIAQLEAFTRLLGAPLHRAENPRQLGQIVAAVPTGETLLIDTAGINPYSARDRDELAALIAAASAEPVLVLPAGGDIFDAIEIAQAFRKLGCTRLLITRLDMVHRLGSTLAAAAEARLGFSDAGITPDVAQGLTPLNPVALARLLLPGTAQSSPSLTPEHVTP
jgi:flagellar biosynthesis protein FlhF